MISAFWSGLGLMLVSPSKGMSTIMRKRALLLDGAQILCGKLAVPAILYDVEGNLLTLV